MTKSEKEKVVLQHIENQVIDFVKNTNSMDFIIININDETVENIYKTIIHD